MTEKEYEKVKEEFDKYYEKFRGISFNIERKYNHSLRVAKLMDQLARMLNMIKEDVILARTIGLLHDIGRFEQIKKTNSFDDTKLDHANYAITYLFDQDHIRIFIKDNKNYEIIKKAIYNHNKYAIEKDLKNRELLFSKMIRDMDKVDIYFTVASKNDMTFENNYTKEVYEEFLNNNSIKIKDRKTECDSVLFMMAYLNDFNFKESFEILKETDNFNIWLSTVKVFEKDEKEFYRIIQICKDKIERGALNVR